MKKEANKTYNNVKFVSPATKLLDKRRSMYEINSKFERQKDEFTEQELKFKKKEKELKDKDT